MDASYFRARIKFWELLRVPYNLVCLVGGWFGWGISNSFNVGIDDMPGARIDDPGVLPHLIFGFVVLNIGYCLIYALEFILLTTVQTRRFSALKMSVYTAGCILGFVIAGRGFSAAAYETSRQKHQREALQMNLEKMRQQPEPSPQSKDKQSRP